MYNFTLPSTSALDGVRCQRHTPAALPTGKRSSTHCIGGWIGPRAFLDCCGKSRPYKESIPEPSSQKQVGIPTALSRPYHQGVHFFIIPPLIVTGMYCLTLCRPETPSIHRWKTWCAPERVCTVPTELGRTLCKNLPLRLKGLHHVFSSVAQKLLVL
jgi:hypothetical protein